MFWSKIAFKSWSAIPEFVFSVGSRCLRRSLMTIGVRNWWRMYKVYSLHFPTTRPFDLNSFNILVVECLQKNIMDCFGATSRQVRYALTLSKHELFLSVRSAPHHSHSFHDFKDIWEVQQFWLSHCPPSPSLCLQKRVPSHQQLHRYFVISLFIFCVGFFLFILLKK